MTEFRLSRLETVAGNAGRACQQAEQNITRRWRDQTTPHAGLSDDFNESPHLCVCVCVFRRRRRVYIEFDVDQPSHSDFQRLGRFQLHCLPVRSISIGFCPRFLVFRRC